MAVKRKWIQAVTVVVDEETGALLVRPGTGYRAISTPAAVTATAGQWTAIDLPAGTEYISKFVSLIQQMGATVTLGGR